MESNETKQSLSDTLKAIDTKYSGGKNTVLKKQIAGAKSSRGPSLAGRISGLQKLKPKLGQQFSKTQTTTTNE